jgi:hypothetical protein
MKWLPSVTTHYDGLVISKEYSSLYGRRGGGGAYVVGTSDPDAQMSLA